MEYRDEGITVNDVLKRKAFPWKAPRQFIVAGSTNFFLFLDLQIYLFIKTFYERVQGVTCGWPLFCSITQHALSVCLSVCLSLSETFFWNDRLVSSTARAKIVITWFNLLRLTRKKLGIRYFSMLATSCLSLVRNVWSRICFFYVWVLMF